MNHRLINAALAATGCLLLANCASTSPQARIDKHPAMYGSLSGAHKEAVREGRLVEGMNKDAVFLAWGRPAGINEGSEGGKLIEKWRYEGHREIVTNQFAMGYGHGYGRRYGYDSAYYSYGPSIEYVPYTAAVVEFSNGKVSSWERER